MERQYVAIDLHRRRSVIVRENEAGEEVGVVRIDNDPVALSLALAEAGPDPEVAIEATYGWYWAVDVLQAQGAQVHLVNPTGLCWEDRRVKNDYRDCEDLIERLRLHKLPEAWIAPPATRELRELVRYRAKLVALRAGLKAGQSRAGQAGLHPPVEDLWGLAGTAYLNGLALDDGYTIRVESLRDLVGFYDREVAMLERVIYQRLRHNPGYQAIQAIEGVGPGAGRHLRGRDRRHRALRLARQAVLGGRADPPRHRESDTKAHRGRITKQGSTLVRWAAVEAISGIRGGPKLKADYHRIAARRGVRIARVAVARKLLTLVYFGLRDGEIRCLTRADEAA